MASCAFLAARRRMRWIDSLSWILAREGDQAEAGGIRTEAEGRGREGVDGREDGEAEGEVGEPNGGSEGGVELGAEEGVTVEVVFDRR